MAFACNVKRLQTISALEKKMVCHAGVVVAALVVYFNGGLRGKETTDAASALTIAG